jgi:hypothetical protein
MSLLSLLPYNFLAPPNLNVYHHLLATDAGGLTCSVISYNLLHKFLISSSIIPVAILPCG